MSEKTKAKLSKAITGRTLSDDHKSAIAAGNNRDYSDPVFREKMSQIAVNRSEKTKKKISENSRRLAAEGKIGMKGRKHSEETKAKMRASYLRRMSGDK